MILALLGGLVGCGAFVVVFAVLIGVLFKKQETDASASDIAAGHTSGLEDWTGSSLAELSRNVVGTWHFKRPFGGRSVSVMTAAICSCRTRGELLRLSAEKQSLSGSGQITLLASFARIDVTFSRAACQIWANGADFGTIDLASARVADAWGRELGVYQRGAGAHRLFLRGRDVAWLKSATQPEAALPAAPEPFCASLAPGADEEATLWLMAVVGIEAGNFAMPARGVGMLT